MLNLKFIEKAIIKKGAVPFFILLSFVVLTHADEPKVSFSVSKREVLLGDSIMLTITVHGVSNPQAPELPSIENFDVKFRGVRKESFSSFSLVIQGNQVKQESSGGGYNFDYELTPKKVGTFTIPPIIIEMSGQSFRTEPIQIKVLDQTQKSRDIFIKVIVDKKNVFLGEKLLVTFKWYFNKNISDYKITVPWLDGLKNFLVTDPEPDKHGNKQPLRINGDKQVIGKKTREVYKGQSYVVISFQKILTPISKGSYKLDPVFLKCEVVKGYKRSGRGSFFDDFFDSDFFGFGRQAITEPFATRSKPLQILVKDVPQEGKPPSYSGAVGDFDFSVKLSPTSLKAGEPITVTMKVSGSGNIGQLKLPPFPEIEAFRSYEPESKTNMSQRGGTLVGEKIFEKVLIPKVQGDYKIPQISFSFFNPKKRSYQTIKRGPFRVHVEKGEATDELKIITLDSAVKQEDTKKELKILRKDIRYIKTELGKTGGSGRAVYEKFWVWMLLYILPLSLLLSLFFLKRRHDRFTTDIGFARRMKAHKEVKKSLKAAQQLISKGSPREFYDVLSKGLNSYIANKLNRSQAGITADIVDELSTLGLSQEDTDKLKKLYFIFDAVLFSSVSADKQKLQSDYDFVNELILKLERIIK